MRETLVTAAGGGAGTGCPSVAWGLEAVDWGGVFETAPEPRGRPRPTEAGGRTGVDIVKHGKNRGHQLWETSESTQIPHIPTPHDTASQGHQNYMEKLKFREKKRQPSSINQVKRITSLSKGEYIKRKKNAKNGYAA